jgi:hypothetical protein
MPDNSLTTRRLICAADLAAVVLPGCMSTQIAATNAVSGIQSIAVVPIQLPIALTPALLQAFETKGAMTSSVPPSQGVGVLATAAFLYILSVEWPEQEDKRNQAMELLAEWAATEDPWDPAVALAEDAAEMLRQDPAHKDVRVNQAVELPGVESREWTWHGENWMKPRRAWYRRNDSLVDAGATKELNTDAILEIAAGPVEVGRESLYLHVALKLISSSTNEVLGRSNCVDFVETAPLEDLFQNQGQLFKSIYGEISDRILDQCMRKAGLLR